MEDNTYAMYNRFLQYWNNGIDEVHTPERRTDTGKYIYVAVVKPETVFIFGLSPFAYNCFQHVFNGSVCDWNHWEYFKDRMFKISIDLTGYKYGLDWFVFRKTRNIAHKEE